MADQETQSLVSPLDPDFLIMAFLAIVVDVLDFVLEIGTVVSLVIGIFFVLWMMWVEGRGINKQELGERTGELQQQHLRVQTQRRVARTTARRALRRGILIFIAELIPLVNLIPFWSIYVFSALRMQSAVPSPAQNATMPQEA